MSGNRKTTNRTQGHKPLFVSLHAVRGSCSLRPQNLDHHSSFRILALLQGVEVFLGIESRHAARARGGDGLAVNPVHDVAGGEDPRY